MPRQRFRLRMNSSPLQGKGESEGGLFPHLPLPTVGEGWGEGDCSPFRKAARHEFAECGGREGFSGACNGEDGKDIEWLRAVPVS